MRIIILIFNGSDKVFINDYSKCIKLKDFVEKLGDNDFINIITLLNACIEE